ncbi:MAG: O-antigen ligase family protein [Bacteroidetes bacterium]|nr:O-antigen ligase family protein [Bacteroidota bacterium]
MKEYIRSNYQFLLLCSLWILVGITAGPIPAIIFILLSVLALKYKFLYEELFLGFAVILILSDSRYKGLAFAADVKVIYILLLSLFFFFDRKNFGSVNKLFYLFAPFLILSLFLIVISDDWGKCFQKTLSYTLLLFVVPNYVVKVYQIRGEFFFRNIVFLFALFLIAGVAMKLAGSPMVSLAGRYRGVFGNPNGLGLFCTIFFLLFFVVQEYYPSLFLKREKIFIYVLIIFSAIASGSRNTIVCLLSFLVFMRLYKLSPFIGFFVLAFIAIGYELIFQNFETIIRYLSLGEYFRIETLATGSGRNVAWHFAWERIQENFFFGKGFAYDEILFYGKDSVQLSMLGHQGNAHNSYLTIWLNTGIIGLFFFARGFLLAFINGAKNSRIAFPVMFTILFSANFESWMAASLNPITIQLWIILTIFTSVEFNENKKLYSLSHID